MATLEALYQAILAAPDDDQPRLAYSDAVAVSDVARAEFIKLQVVLARWRKAHENPDTRPQTNGRMVVLRNQHGKRWASEIAKLVDGYAFYRGFVELVAIDADKFLATAPLLYRTAPVLHLDLTNVKPYAAALFASPHLARVRSLSLLRTGLGDEEVAMLAASPYLGSLQWLSLSNNAISATGIETLAASDRLAKLAYVDLDFNPGENPVPQFVDLYGSDTALGIELRAKFGPRRWLSSDNRDEWPPPRDAAE